MTFKKIFTTFFIFVFSFSSAFSVNEKISLSSGKLNKTESENNSIVVPKREDDKDSQKFKLNSSSTWATSENLWIQNISKPSSQTTNSLIQNNSSTWVLNTWSWTWSQNLSSWSQNNLSTWTTNSWNTNSWSINFSSTNTWTTNSDFVKDFQIKNTFQNPTYLLEKDQEKEEYFCEKDDCKVNFDFRQSFSESFTLIFHTKNGIILSSESLVFHSFHNTYYYNYHFLRKRI